MFTRREKPKVPTFEERLQTMGRMGILSAKKGPGSAAVMRSIAAGVVKETGANTYLIASAGIVMGNEIGELVDGGNQKFWLTKSGKKQPALAEELREVHALVEDVREALGMTSLYNEGLGSVNTHHLYDRVRDRDQGVPKRPWERSAGSR
jgi:hypothetical protein